MRTIVYNNTGYKPIRRTATWDAERTVLTQPESPDWRDGHYDVIDDGEVLFTISRYTWRSVTNPRSQVWDLDIETDAGLRSTTRDIALSCWWGFDDLASAIEWAMNARLRDGRWWLPADEVRKGLFESLEKVAWRYATVCPPREEDIEVRDDEIIVRLKYAPDPTKGGGR